MRIKIIAASIILIILATTIYLLTVKSYQTGEQQKNANRLQIVTSFYPLYFFTTQIVGDKADIYNITPAGVEPHDYEPNTRDIMKIEDSSILILNGGQLETWGNRIKENLKDKNTLVITAGETIANQSIKDNGENIIDPHIWLNPTMAKKEAAVIFQAISQVDPDNKDFYNANTEQLLTKLDNLDLQFKKGLEKCTKKDIITSHTAFGYLASEYQLRQVAISGLSPDAEPSIQDLAKVADFVKNNQVKYIFFESLVSPKLSQTIAAETGASTLELNPIEGLSAEEIQNGKNYFSKMENNLKNLKIALECQ